MGSQAEPGNQDVHLVITVPFVVICEILACFNPLPPGIVSQYHWTVWFIPSSKPMEGSQPSSFFSLEASMAYRRSCPGLSGYRIKDSGLLSLVRMYRTMSRLRVPRVTADIEDFSRTTLAQDHVDGTAMVFHVYPVPHIHAITVHRKFLVLEGIGDHERYELLRELKRPVIIRTTGYDRIHVFVRLLIRPNHQIRPSFGRGIRAVGHQLRRLG